MQSAKWRLAIVNLSVVGIAEGNDEVRRRGGNREEAVVFGVFKVLEGVLEDRYVLGGRVCNVARESGSCERDIGWGLDRKVAGVI